MPTVLPLIITFFGLISDPDFAAADSINVELVETGANVVTQFNKQFKLELPQDTVWNICVVGGQESNESLEKCYELKYLGGDSTFSAEISGADNVVWFADSDKPLATNHSPLAEEPNTNFIPEETQAPVEQVTELRKVVVQLRKKPKRKLGESVVSAKNIKRMPGLAEADVMRSIQALPGVVASSDFSTKIYVRGGASDQNLFLLDNGIVYSPTHFFGLFSTFLVEPIEEVKFYKSGFPAEYGNRLSSVAAVNSRQGGNDTLNEWFSSNSIKISTFAAQAHTEGHQGNARWVVAGRTTYIKQILDALHAAGATDFTIDYKFTDIQGAFDYKINDNLEWHWAVYTGADILNFSPLFVKWGNTVLPVTLRYKINNNWKIDLNYAYSRFSQDFQIEELLGMQNGITTHSFRFPLTYTGIENHAYTFGYDLEYSEISFVQDVELNGQKLEDKPNTRHHILYAQDTWRPDAWDLQYGLRLNYHELSRHFGIEPRFAASWEFAENQKVQFHTGYYLQYLNSIMFSEQEALNEFYYPSRKTKINGTVKPSSSILTSIGYSRNNILGIFNFNAETYYKTLNNLTVYDQSDINDSTAKLVESLGDLLIPGEGYSFGYELTLAKPEGKVSGSINFNQGWSVFKDGPSDAYFPNWHQPYALKGDLCYNWFEETYFLRTSLQLKYASGMPYTPYLGYLAAYEMDLGWQGFNTMTPLGNRNAAMKTPYFRLDAKLIDWGKKDKWNFGFTILNLTDHENLFYVFYDTRKNPPEVDNIYQFPFFPLLMNWEYYF